ncbi:SET domain-containing protein [Candidatus Nomurabacteria bacterium]|nr:SET domain-containing protein [Candidatus Nomurabacteria bacterium]
MAKKQQEPIPRKQLAVKRGINGLGIFTMAPIEKGTYIIDYVGKLLTADEADAKGGQYLFEINSKWTIDGSARSNLARYINHSCRPNCESDTFDRSKRITITAIKNIPAGEELTYDYGKSFWNEYIKPKGCNCAKCIEKRSQENTVKTKKTAKKA